MIKKLIKVGESQAVTIPAAYLQFWHRLGKEIREFELEINKKIVLTPILTDIKEETKSCYDTQNGVNLPLDEERN